MKIANLLIFSSSTILFLCAVIPFFSSTLIPANNWLLNFTNIFGFLGMIFSALALLIASLAYKAAMLRPKLELKFGPKSTYKNRLSLPVDYNTGEIIFTEPTSEWIFNLYNNGNASARYPMVQLSFDEALFPEDAFPGWTATNYLDARGYLSFQWSPGNELVIHPGFPIQLPNMRFTGYSLDINNSSTIKVNVIIAADGFDKETYSYTVELEKF